MKLSAVFLTLTLAAGAFAHGEAPLHLDLEMTMEEYQAHLKKIPKSTLKLDDPAVTYGIQLGERLSQWINLVNTRRSPETAVRLTSPQTRRGTPIDKASQYSPKIIGENTKKVLEEMPAKMKAVILKQIDMTSELPLDDETFILHARKLSKVYQDAARYKSVDQYRSYYTQAATRDIRGYYYLKSNKITAENLRDRALIPQDQVEPIKNALTGLCRNAQTGINCKSAVELAFSENKIAEFYKNYMPVGEATWKQFFDIPGYGVRKDIVWQGNTMITPFNTPTIPKFLPYLKDNIEAEFRWKNWSLKMNFGTFPDGPLLKFEPNVVPHVNALGGNEIVMDSNQPIEEYESQWTIRHEFGHVLGLPDCYHEFYDVNLNAYVNYQLDITDLMCSRAGDMNERIYKELKRVYKK